MKWKEFRKTELFNLAGIVFCVRDNQNVSPKPNDRIRKVYPVNHPTYPNVLTIVCVLV